MAEIFDLLSNYGVMIVIVGLFLWDWVDNRKSIKGSLDEMAKSNANTSKSLDLLQKSMENQVNELTEHDKRSIEILDLLKSMKN